MNSITVITPIYKGEKYIKKLCTMIEKNCIRLKEKYPETKVEYVLVNDSPTIAIIEPKLSQYYELRIINNKENSGIHQSRVNAILNSESEFIYMLDQDDEMDDRFLLSQYSKIGNKDMIVANGFRKFETENKLLYKTKAAQLLVVREHMYLYGTDMILSPGQCLIRRNAIPDKWVEYILKVNGCDDFALWLLMFEDKKKVAINEEKLYFHTESIENYSASSDNMTLSYMEMCHMLSKNNLIKNSKIKILIRRYQFKIYIKDNNRTKKLKLMQTIKNLDIVLNTLIYKGLGYH